MLMTSCAPSTSSLTSTPMPMTWADLLARPRPTADKTVRYGDDPYQVVDFWRPTGRGPHPVVIMVHGGCWTTSIADRTLMDWAAADLRGRGIAVWNIDYRGVDRPGGAPNGIFADVGKAADTLQQYAGLDLSRVVAVGHSAGGHLALWLAARPRVTGYGLSRPIMPPLPIAHVISLGGLPDLEQAFNEKQGCGAGPIDKLAGQINVRSGSRLNPGGPVLEALGRFAAEGLYADRSIPLLAPLGVPQTLVNGDADKIIPTNFAHDYAAKMRTAGDRVDVRIVPNQGHVELIAPGTPAWAEAVRAIEAALGR